MNIHKRTPARNIPGEPLPRVDHTLRRPGTFVQQAIDNNNGIMPPGNRPEQNGTDNANQAAPAGGDHVIGNAGHNGGLAEGDQNMNNADGFREYRPRGRGRRNRAVFGRGDDDVISGGLQKHELFVFQVNKSKTAEEVKSYMERRELTVTSIKLVSVDVAASNSFHVIVHCMDIRLVMDPEFWPSGVGCRKFIKRRPQQNFD